MSNSSELFLQERDQLKIFEHGLTKREISQLAARSVDAILESGEPLKIAEALSTMENVIKEIRGDKKFVDFVREEAVKHKGGFKANSGAKIELAETGVRYDFSGCNDPILSVLEEHFEFAKEKLEERKEFLKRVPLGGIEVLINEEELVTVYPPTKTSTSSYKVTLASQ